MLLGTGIARRTLGGVGIVAVLFTPTTPRSVPGSEAHAENTVFARTLAPGDHAGVVRRPNRSERDASWAGPGTMARAALLGAIAVLVSAVSRLRPPRRPRRPGSSEPVLLRAPTRSPPVPALAG
jgi:hypothetical protein